MAFIQQSPHAFNNNEVIAARRYDNDTPNVLVHLHLDKSRYNHELSPEQQRALSGIVKKTKAKHVYV